MRKFIWNCDIVYTKLRVLYAFIKCDADVCLSIHVITIVTLILCNASNVS